MPIALWTLLWLNARAVVRRMVRRAKTGRGAVLSIVGLLMLGLWLVPSVFLNGRLPRADPTVVRTVGPVAVLGMCVLNLLSSAGERAVTFAPAEVDFLFPGPFTRRQLLVYKLVKTGLVGVPSALLFALVLGRYGGTYFGRAIAAWLTFQFVQMVAMASALVQSTVGERAFGRGRRWVLLALLGVVVAAVAPAAWRHRDVKLPVLAGHLQASPVGHALLAPFAVFPQAITAERLVPTGLAWDAAAAVMVAALVAVVFALDANYLETAATASGKRYARVARMRQAGLAGTASAASASLRVPMLPWLGGAGPVAWRQLTGVVRTSRGLLLVLGVVALAAGGAVAHADSTPRSVGSLVGISMWVNLFLTSMLKFDFRGDIDHVDTLRSLPVRPAAVAAGEVVAPTAVLSAVQLLLLAAVAAFGHLPARGLVLAAAFVVPVNALLVTSENLLFLLFPYRPPAAVAGDMGMVGRQTVVFLCRAIVLVSVLSVAIVIGVATLMLTGGRFDAGGRPPFTGGSLAAAAAAAWACLAAGVAVGVLLMGLAFNRLDPTVDAPA